MMEETPGLYKVDRMRLRAQWQSGGVRLQGSATRAGGNRLLVYLQSTQTIESLCQAQT